MGRDGAKDSKRQGATFGIFRRDPDSKSFSLGSFAFIVVFGRFFHGVWKCWLCVGSVGSSTLYDLSALASIVSGLGHALGVRRSSLRADHPWTRLSSSESTSVDHASRAKSDPTAVSFSFGEGDVHLQRLSPVLVPAACATLLFFIRRWHRQHMRRATETAARPGINH